MLSTVRKGGVIVVPADAPVLVPSPAPAAAAPAARATTAVPAVAQAAVPAVAQAAVPVVAQAAVPAPSVVPSLSVVPSALETKLLLVLEILGAQRRSLDQLVVASQKGLFVLGLLVFIVVFVGFLYLALEMSFVAVVASK
jgi:hypothetical protein